MKELRFAAVLPLIMSVSSACTQMQVTPNAITKLEELKSQDKFVNLSPGLQHPEQQGMLDSLLNVAIVDFIDLIRAPRPHSTADFVNAIERGLHRFDAAELDSEDREKVANNFEHIMDIIGLESSGGKLNEFVYGWDPGSK